MKMCRILFWNSFGLCLVLLAADVMAGDLYLEQPVASGVYSAGNNIIVQNNCLIEPNSTVLLLAGQEILLKPGFHATQGAQFKAMIGDYSNIPEDMDIDNDDLPDWREVKYFSDTLSSGSGVDADGDGVSDSVEFKLGANPAMKDLPGPGVHYEYDALGRIKRIYRIPVE